jgi:hypothetical protein
MYVQRGPDLGRDMRSTGGVFGFFPRRPGGIMINTKEHEARDISARILNLADVSNLASLGPENEKQKCHF